MATSGQYEKQKRKMNTAAQQYRKKMLKLKRHFVWLPKNKK